MADDPSKKPPGRRRDAGERPPEAVPGRLASDDRGNITWEWANHDELQADDTAGGAERLRALIDPSLDIVDDGSVGSPTKRPATGYNPYDSSTGATPERKQKKKKRSLQELSKWIETKRKVEGESGE